MNEERIKCAAILHDGKVHKGSAHCEIGIAMVKLGSCDSPYPGGSSQGFVTQDDRFVSRGEALSIAIAAGQVVEGKTRSNTELFSEDLRGHAGMVTTKDGLLWMGGEIIRLPWADMVANARGFLCAEDLVKALDKGREWA